MSSFRSIFRFTQPAIPFEDALAFLVKSQPNCADASRNVSNFDPNWNEWYMRQHCPRDWPLPLARIGIDEDGELVMIWTRHHTQRTGRIDLTPPYFCVDDIAKTWSLREKMVKEAIANHELGKAVSGGLLYRTKDIQAWLTRLNEAAEREQA